MEKIIGFVIIATGKYDRFVKPLLDSMFKYCFEGYKIDIYLLTDRAYNGKYDNKIEIKRMFVPHMYFPFPTLYRYKWITEYADAMTADNIFYIDVDMLFVDHVGEEILGGGLVATRHPGYYNGGWGDNETTPHSRAFIPHSLRGNYYAGGFQGGEREAYLRAAKTMSEWIEEDENNGVMARWHDESQWNKYLSLTDKKELSPAYCMVEQKSLREKWGIADIEPRIIALEKNHKEVRS